jgi:hypothetical protein
MDEEERADRIIKQRERGNGVGRKERKTGEE